MILTFFNLFVYRLQIVSVLRELMMVGCNPVVFVSRDTRFKC